MKTNEKESAIIKEGGGTDVKVGRN